MTASSPSSARPQSFIVIPARLASTRLPRKLLLNETGQPLLQHTYESASRATKPAGLCVAADSPEIAAAVEAFGGRVELTDPDLPSGTDRVAAVARRIEDAEIIVNVQGDEPEIAAEGIDLVIGLLEDNPQAVMATVAAPIRTREQVENPACVKVVFDAAGRAIYFSRSAIPHARTWSDDLLTAEPAVYYQHIGLYAYRRDFLQQLAQMPPTVLEQVECLEQLRVLSAGHEILVGVVDQPTVGIDTPEDYRAFVARWRGRMM